MKQSQNSNLAQNPKNGDLGLLKTQVFLNPGLVVTLRYLVNETSINDMLDEPDSAGAVESVREKMKTDNAGDGAVDSFAVLFNSSMPMMVDEVDSCMSGMEVSDNLLCFWQGKSNAWQHLAKHVLAVPATTASSGRTLSLAEATLSERRTQLNPDAVDVLLFLHGP